MARIRLGSSEGVTPLASRGFEPKYHGRMTSGNRHPRSSGLKKHSLGLAVGSIVAVWFVLYVRGDPSTHSGAFYGNALADWLGSFMIVITTKYFYELGSPESRQPHPRTGSRLTRFVIDHSLTIVLIVTGASWAALLSGIGSARQNGTGGRQYRVGMDAAARARDHDEVSPRDRVEGKQMSPLRLQIALEGGALLMPTRLSATRCVLCFADS